MKKLFTIIICALLFTMLLGAAAFADTETDEILIPDEAVQDNTLLQETDVLTNKDDPETVQKYESTESEANTGSPVYTYDVDESDQFNETAVPTDENIKSIEEIEDSTEAISDTDDSELSQIQDVVKATDEEEISNNYEGDSNEKIVNKGGDVSTPSENKSSSSEEENISDGAAENITVDNITVGKSPANDKYSYLSFSFSNDQDEALLVCYITGFEIMPGSEYGESTASAYAELCKDIAESYYKNEQFKISDEQTFRDKYSLYLKPIDAEKDNLDEEESFSESTESTKSSKVIQDSGLCWAAAASNLLEYTAWAEKVRSLYPELKEKLENEDALFTYYTDKFYNRGLNSASGVRFFIDGINIDQDSYQGKIWYDDNSKKAQVKKEEENGFLKQYCADDIVSSKERYELKATSTLDDIAEDVELLKSGYGIGLGFNAHSTTLFGFIKDKLLSGINSLRAIFIADSDNDAEITPKPSKEAKPNSITMYTNIARGEIIKEDDIVITNWSIVKPYSDSITEDRSGKMDSQQFVDYSATEVYIVKNSENEDSDKDKSGSYSIGDTIELDVKIGNYSYKSLSLEREPHIHGSYIIKVDGEAVDSIYVDLPLQEYECYPNSTVYSDLKRNYTLKYEGDYEISFTIDGIYYNDGSKADEAYYSNNTTKRNVSLSIARTPVPVIIPTYNESAGNNLKHTFYCKTSDFSSLRIDGKIIDKSLYRIDFLGNNMYEIEISPYALAGLSKGTHNVEILTSQNETAVLFTITVQ